MPRVFAPNIPTRYDPLTEARVPVFNVAPATDWGEIVQLIPMNTEIRNKSPRALIDTIAEGLEDFTADDFILCVGDPALIGAAIAAAMRKAGKCRALRWERVQKCYEPMEIEL